MECEINYSYNYNTSNTMTSPWAKIAKVKAVLVTQNKYIKCVEKWILSTL